MNEDYDTIRKQAEQRVKKREDAKEGLIAFFLINGFLWILWFAAWLIGLLGAITIPTFLILFIITFIWGFFAVGEWLEIVYLAQERERRFQEEVEREIERELAKRALTQKRKRIAVSDDGELVEITEEEETKYQQN